MGDIYLALTGAIKTLEKSFRADNKKLAQIVSLIFAKCDDYVFSSAERTIHLCFDIVDDASERIPIPISNTSILVFAFKIGLVGIAAIPIHMINFARKDIFQLRKSSKDKIKIADLPEECIGEIRALEKRWQKQNLSDEEIQANIEFFKRDMQIGQRNMKRDEIKHKIWSLTMRMMSQLGQLLSI